MVTVAVLAALVVGGAALAQAQNAATPITAPTHQNVGEETSPGDTDSASGQGEAPDSASKADTPDGPTEPADQGSQED